MDSNCMPREFAPRVAHLTFTPLQNGDVVQYYHPVDGLQYYYFQGNGNICYLYKHLKEVGMKTRAITARRTSVRLVLEDSEELQAFLRADTD
jgi:hypothetical protein